MNDILVLQEPDSLRSPVGGVVCRGLAGHGLCFSTLHSEREKYPALTAPPRMSVVKGRTNTWFGEHLPTNAAPAGNIRVRPPASLPTCVGSDRFPYLPSPPLPSPVLFSPSPPAPSNPRAPSGPKISPPLPVARGGYCRTRNLHALFDFQKTPVIFLCVPGLVLICLIKHLKYLAPFSLIAEVSTPSLVQGRAGVVQAASTGTSRQQCFGSFSFFLFPCVRY